MTYQLERVVTDIDGKDLWVFVQSVGKELDNLQKRDGDDEMTLSEVGCLYCRVEAAAQILERERGRFEKWMAERGLSVLDRIHFRG